MTVPVKVKVIGAGGVPVTSFGGGTEYAEDTPHTGGDSLTMAGVVQQAADIPLAGDGDRTLLQVDANGYLKVNIKSNSAGTAAGIRAEDSPSTSGDSGVFVLGIRNDDLADRTDAAGDYSTFSVDRVGRMKVVQPNLISTANSSTATLGSGATFTGTFEDVSAFADVSVIVFADVASAANGLKIEWSSDGTNIDEDDLFTIAAGTGRRYGFGIMSRYVRVRYVNGGTIQAAFRLQTIYHGGSLGEPRAEKEEDTAHTSSDIGTFVLGVRNDNAAALTGTDGDYSALAVDSAGRLMVNVSTNAAATDFTKVEDAGHASGDRGAFVLGVRNDNASTAFVATNLDYTPLSVDASGRLFTRQTAVTSTRSTVADTTTGTQLLGANNARLGAFITNDSSARLYLMYGSGVPSATDYTASLAQHETHQVPFGFVGVIAGIWASDPNDGAARITELT